MTPWIIAGVSIWSGIAVAAWALVRGGCLKPTPPIEEPCGCEPAAASERRGWVSEDFTEHAEYVPEVDAVRYTQVASEYSVDGLRIPGVVTVWLSEAVVRDVLDLFPQRKGGDQC